MSRDVREALSALRAWRSDNWKHAAWIEHGYPNLTDQEHREWFGSDYVKAKPKRQK